MVFVMRDDDSDKRWWRQQRRRFPFNYYSNLNIVFIETVLDATNELFVVDARRAAPCVSYSRHTNILCKCVCVCESEFFNLQCVYGNKDNIISLHV